MTAVPVTGVVSMGLGRKDSRPWKAWSPVYRQGSVGEVITTRGKEFPVRVVAGVFSAMLEPGVVVLENPDGKQYTVTVPALGGDLWDIIDDAVAFPPDTSAEALAAAVTGYLQDNPVVTMQVAGLTDASESGAAVLTGDAAAGRTALEIDPAIEAEVAAQTPVEVAAQLPAAIAAEDIPGQVTAAVASAGTVTDAAAAAVDVAIVDADILSTIDILPDGSDEAVSIGSEDGGRSWIGFTAVGGIPWRTRLLIAQSTDRTITSIADPTPYVPAGFGFLCWQRLAADGSGIVDILEGVF